jgi:molybdopterin synthase sulfur carrier subunit
MIRVALPHHLQTLAKVGREIELTVEGPITIGAVLDRLEIQYLMLRGTIRDQVTRERRPSLESYDTRLPDSVVTGAEPFRIVGAMAGG